MRYLGFILVLFFYFFNVSLVSAAEQIPTTNAVAASTTIPFDVKATVDTDGDELTDQWEIFVFKTDPNKKDSDGDSFSDSTEIKDIFDPLKKNIAKNFEDQDKDGLDDRLEWLFKTDPFNSDTDGDGFTDGNEVTKGFDPRSGSKKPLKKRIRIDLSKQIMQQELGGVVLANFRVSTGKKGMATPTGDFAIKEKIPRAWSRSAKLWMPYWMKFTDRGHGIHELPEWPGGKKEGVNHLGVPVSHGCVRLGIGPAKTMYEWAPVGTIIHIEH
ncbi:L,D-transpeptidase [Candidatus Uhrbacteria bacterium]|nr:L,D-transpeptidase [Candidatus Uhrbacteria bacterium]